MHSSRKQSRLLLAILVAFATSAVSSGPLPARQLSVFSEGSNFSVVVKDESGRDYVNLFELLRPLGKTETREDGKHWKITFNNVSAEFSSGTPRFKLQKQERELLSPFLLEPGGGYVPLDSVTTLLPFFLGTPVTLHQNSRRLFVGNPAVHFTAQVSGSTPPVLTLNFSGPVNPSISTEPGKLRMTFTHEPIVAPGTNRLSFASKAIPYATYSEDNGAAEITVAGGAPLFARFSDDGRTITIGPAAQNPPVATAAVTPQGGPPPLARPENFGAAAVPSSSPSLSLSIPVFAAIDAAHGGDDRGEQISPQLAEKDITLALAIRLRQELQVRGMTVLLLRDSDVSISADQRASAANQSRAAIYVSLHAVSLGSGVRVYTSLLPEGGENRGPFLDWQTAQSGFHTLSSLAAKSVAGELSRRQVRSRTLIAPQRPLNNLALPAIALEMTPQSAVADLSSPAYQQLVAESVANAIAGVRERLLAKP